MESKKCIVITGARGSGKSRKAREIVEGKKHITVYAPDFFSAIEKNHYLLCDAEKDTEYIVIDDIPKKKLNKKIDKLKDFLSSESIRVEKRGKPLIEISPKFILIFQENIALIDLGFEIEVINMP